MISELSKYQKDLKVYLKHVALLIEELEAILKEKAGFTELPTFNEYTHYFVDAVKVLRGVAEGQSDLVNMPDNKLNNYCFGLIYHLKHLYNTVKSEIGVSEAQTAEYNKAINLLLDVCRAFIMVF